MKAKLIVFLTMCFGTAVAQTNYVLNFNGTSNSVDLGTSVGSGVRAIEFWFRPASDITPSTTASGYSFILRNDAGQLNEYGFYIRGTDWPTGRGNMYFFMRDNGTLHEISSNGSSWAVGTWYHICGTIDAVTGMKLYVNAALQTSNDPGGTAAIPLSSEVTKLGVWGDAPVRYFAGRMDELRFWSRSLSPSEIANKMCYWLFPANEPGLVGYWKMNEGSGPTILDAAGTNNGTIAGATFIGGDNCIAGYVGLDETMTSNEIPISISPNPLSTEAVLRLDRSLTKGIIQVYNGLGQAVMRLENFTGNTAVLHRDKLPNGSYLLRVVENDKTLGWHKFTVGD